MQLFMAIKNLYLDMLEFMNDISFLSNVKQYLEIVKLCIS